MKEQETTTSGDPFDVYLGDALYASFDGYQIVLKANSTERPTDIVYLDPWTLEKFLIYVKELKLQNKIKNSG